jgi:hypothetical protein
MGGMVWINLAQDRDRWHVLAEKWGNLMNGLGICMLLNQLWFI